MKEFNFVCERLLDFAICYGYCDTMLCACYADCHFCANNGTAYCLNCSVLSL